MVNEPYVIKGRLSTAFFSYLFSFCIHFTANINGDFKGEKRIWCILQCLNTCAFVAKHSGPDFSKITTIHSNPELIDAESERITKIIKGEVSHVQVLFGAFNPMHWYVNSFFAEGGRYSAARKPPRKLTQFLHICMDQNEWICHSSDNAGKYARLISILSPCQPAFVPALQTSSQTFSVKPALISNNLVSSHTAGMRRRRLVKRPHTSKQWVESNWALGLRESCGATSRDQTILLWFMKIIFAFVIWPGMFCLRCYIFLSVTCFFQKSNNNNNGLVKQFEILYFLFWVAVVFFVFFLPLSDFSIIPQFSVKQCFAAVFQ